MRLALLEDDPAHGQLMRGWLEEAGHRCHLFETGARLLAAAARESYDLYLLDWQVPDTSGLAVLRTLRAQPGFAAPVLFVTSRDSEHDIVEALGAGADDYLVKPPRRLELVARVAALGRRGGQAEAGSATLAAGIFTLDPNTRQVRCAYRVVELTHKEFDLAWLLFSHIGQVVSRGHLLERVWGHGAEISTRTLDTHVSRLRTKLALTPDHGVRLVSVYGYGYRLEQIAADEA